MAEHSRYSISSQGAGLENGVLKNNLGIKDQEGLDDVETLLLSDAYQHFFDLLEQGEVTFDHSLLLEMHAYFLGTLYAWAGKLRRVNVSKDGILFAPADQVKRLLEEFEPVFKRNIPRVEDTRAVMARKLALVHNGLNAIHPFREGNGRTIRLLVDLIAAHAGYGPINWNESGQEVYIAACKNGMARDHRAMERIIYRGLMI